MLLRILIPRYPREIADEIVEIFFTLCNRTEYYQQQFAITDAITLRVHVLILWQLV